MQHPRRVIFFLVVSVIFAATHLVALALSLYWYFWWFDIIMHYWGGLLLGLGLHTLAPLSPIPVRPTTGLMLFVLFVATVSWEIFEWFAGLYDPSSYLFDTSKDIVVGFAGGLLAHTYLLRRYNKDT